MHDIVKEAVDRVVKISAPARLLAKHFEDNPTDLPISLLTSDEALHSIDQDEIIGFDRFKQLFNNSITGLENYKKYLEVAYRSIELREKNWPQCPDRTTAKKLLDKQFRLLPAPKKNEPPHNVRKFKLKNWECILTSRDLNLIIRSAYLPASFPFISDKKETKFSEALFCFFACQLNTRNTPYSERLMDIIPSWFNKTLVGDSKSSIQASTLKRAFPDKFNLDNKFSSHQLRHLLNTVALKNDVSGFELAAWSSRKDLRQNAAYDQITDEEMVERTRGLISKGESSRAIEVTVIDGPNIEEVPHLAVQETPFGRCSSPWAVSPCELNGDCIACNSLACIKGEQEKEMNIREEIKRYKIRLRRAISADREGSIGADKWVSYYLNKINRGEELIAVFDNDEVPKGSLIIPKLNDHGLTSATHKALQNSGNLKGTAKPIKALSLMGVMALTGGQK